MLDIYVYTYNSDEQRFSHNGHMRLEREIINIESRNEHELVYAVNKHLDTPIRIALASKSGKVYFDKASQTYRVWFYTPDRDAAIAAIGNYILDNISETIRTHQSFIDRLTKERDNAIDILMKSKSTD